jgi:hypothetical protein
MLSLSSLTDYIHIILTLLSNAIATNALMGDSAGELGKIASGIFNYFPF